MLSALLLLAAASAAYAGQVTVTRTYDTSAITLGTETAPDGTQFQSIGWPGLDCNAETGAPQLPVEYIRLMVPVYSNNFRVTLQSATGAYQLPLQSKVIAGQIPQATDGSPAPEFTYPDGEAYTAAGANARVVSHGYIDGCNHLVTVAVCPVAYDGATEATAYGSVTVRLDYDECTEAGLEGSRPLFPPYASPYVDVAGMVANTPDVARFRAARLPDATKGEYADWYYIIVPENLEQAVADLALWKRQKGYNVVVKTIESILATPEYAVGALNPVYGVNPTDTIVDSAESLRIYLKDEYESHGAFFCLLVGNDRTSMPVRKVLWLSCASQVDFYLYDNGEYTVPTDCYFSDLTTKWPLSKFRGLTIYSCDINSVNYHPSIHIGRLLCQYPDEITNYLKKLVLYEANPGYGDNDYLGKSIFIEASDVGENESVVVQDAISSILTPTYIKDTGNKDYPTANYAIEQMKNFGFQSLHGHGSPYSVAICNYFRYLITSKNHISNKKDGYNGVTTDYFINEDANGLDNLDNGKKPSILYSVSCHNNPFDIMEGIDHYKYDLDMNLGESYTVGGDYGGPAFLGNTRAGLCTTSAFLERDFVNIIQNCNKVGIAETYSRYNFFYNELSFIHNLIGEPEFEMWLGKPKYLDWQQLKAYSSEWFSKPEAFGSIWTIWNGNDRFFSYRCQGKTPLVNTELLNKDHVVSVWKSGYLPMIHYNGINNTISNESKRFIVRSATLGYSLNGILSLNKFFVSEGGVLSIHAVDSISGSSNFEVESGGNVSLDCDQKVELTGSTVRNGGKMAVEAEKVTLGPGFRVEAGGTLTITSK